MHRTNLYSERTVSGNIEMSAESSDWAWIGPADVDECKIAFRRMALALLGNAAVKEPGRPVARCRMHTRKSLSFSFAPAFLKTYI
jgi:hypothetical protein